MSILALTSNTLVTAASGQIEYNGQFFGTDSNASRAQLQRITQGTAVASTSGTSIDFTGLPAWVKRITVIFNGVSLNGTANILVQIGSGSFTTSGYTSQSYATNNSGFASTAGFACLVGAAVQTILGTVTITAISGNTWISSQSYAIPGSVVGVTGGGGITLGGVLDRVRITTTNGTDTFDAGSINIIYEG